MNKRKRLDLSDDSPERSARFSRGRYENLDYDEKKSSGDGPEAEVEGNQSPGNRAADDEHDDWDDGSEFEETESERSGDRWDRDYDDDGTWGDNLQEDADDNESSGDGSQTPPPTYSGLIGHFTRLAEGITDDVIIAAPTMVNPNPELPPHHVPDTFHLFSRLPTEIRLKIWALSRIAPHILHVKYQHDDFVYTFKRPYLGSIHNICSWIFENKKDPFTSLAICQESRLEALKSRFFQDYERIHLHGDVTQRAWFNFKTDTYFLNTVSALSTLFLTFI